MQNCNADRLFWKALCHFNVGFPDPSATFVQSIMRLSRLHLALVLLTALPNISGQQTYSTSLFAGSGVINSYEGTGANLEFSGFTYVLIPKAWPFRRTSSRFTWRARSDFRPPSAQNAPRRASTLILLQHSQNPHRLPSTFALLHADAVHDGRARAS